MRYGLFDGNVTGSEDGQPVAPLMGQFQDYDGGAGDYQMGPLTFMLNYPDHCVLYRFCRGPHGNRCELVWFVRGDAKAGEDFDVDRVTWLWHHTTQEDEYIIMRNSEGLTPASSNPALTTRNLNSPCRNLSAGTLQRLSGRSQSLRTRRSPDHLFGCVRWLNRVSELGHARINEHPSLQILPPQY